MHHNQRHRHPQSALYNTGTLVPLWIDVDERQHQIHQTKTSTSITACEYRTLLSLTNHYTSSWVLALSTIFIITSAIITRGCSLVDWFVRLSAVCDEDHRRRSSVNFVFKLHFSTSKDHRRRSSVNFGGQDIFSQKYMHEKLTKCPNFT